MSWMSSPHVTSGSACLSGRCYINTISTSQTPITSIIGLLIRRSITLNRESCIVPSADNLCHPSSGCLAASSRRVRPKCPFFRGGRSHEAKLKSGIMLDCPGRSGRRLGGLRTTNPFTGVLASPDRKPPDRTSSSMRLRTLLKEERRRKRFTLRGQGDMEKKIRAFSGSGQPEAQTPRLCAVAVCFRVRSGHLPPPDPVSNPSRLLAPSQAAGLPITDLSSFSPKIMQIYERNILGLQGRRAARDFCQLLPRQVIAGQGDTRDTGILTLD
ncbi:uncharacterized protein BO96DRAFT_493677 [Aspergillus niger CBS 101883]|uniref:Uncharacterized protein n=2 Tax=Aspergillus niger TaxID=5061 RepID=E2PSN6_ASPNC|nr:uncharacterized protein BO96DRAFT_493677 [Aspergillus niger CBS 101883]XP_059605758.1 hypothetical protein An07g05720 [Aspergillus niger]PYH57541.1 hypothetical protein BO96DRAFT_493677 [Aspergillus niger CBS 101883]CAK48943.1 hypothetical protein An07g05720 [Aspergillus niger]